MSWGTGTMSGLGWEVGLYRARPFTRTISCNRQRVGGYVSLVDSIPMGIIACADGVPLGCVIVIGIEVVTSWVRQLYNRDGFASGPIVSRLEAVKKNEMYRTVYGTIAGWCIVE